jgi:hypothetical protein
MAGKCTEYFTREETEEIEAKGKQQRIKGMS